MLIFIKANELLRGEKSETKKCSWDSEVKEIWVLRETEKEKESWKRKMWARL